MHKTSLDFLKIENGILKIKMLDSNHYLELFFVIAAFWELIKDFVNDDINCMIDEPWLWNKKWISPSLIDWG